MSTAWKVVAFIGLFLLGMLFLGIALGMSGTGLLPQFIAFFVVLVVTAMCGWVTFTFFHYRFIRQEELLHVLQTAAQANVPLGPTLWAYVRERPQSTWREFMVSIMLFPVYYWSWHRWYSYDRKVEQLALILERGAPLHLALNAVPGVASRETALAAAIGQSSGQMATCLNQVTRWQLAGLWLEVIPRLVYPLILIIIAIGIMTFQLIFMVPRFEKIFADFKMHLPWLTEQTIHVGRWVGRHGWAIGFAVLDLCILFGVLLFSSRLTWYFPIIGRLYRMHAQARVLKALSILLETGKPIPQALDLLMESGYFPGTVERRLQKVRQAVEQGQPLPETLYQNGLLPRSMVPLVQAAGRADNLPWALAELGESQAKCTMRRAERLTMAIFPISIMAVGLGVALVAFGMFLPLIDLISELPV